jgi:preprotein translocase subunit SecE
MSRLLKKIPAEEKKKKAETKKTLPPADTASTARTPSVPGTFKPKPEVKNPGTVKEKSTHFINDAVEFLREVKVELKKVTWPTRKQTTGTTIVVIIFVFIVAVFLGFFDFGLSKLVQVVLT